MRSARFADNQFGWQHIALSAFTLDQLEQRINQNLAGRAIVLLYGGQRGVGKAGSRDIVKADNGDIARYGEACTFNRPDGADGYQVAGGKNRIKADAAVDQLLRSIKTRLFGIQSVDLQTGPDIQPCCGNCLLCPQIAVPEFGIVAGGIPEKGNMLSAMRDQMLGC